MSRRTIIKKNIKGLLDFKSILDHGLEARVGILGSNAISTRGKGGGLTNSDIGFKHEVGVKSEKIPKRSFLREPIQEKFEQAAIKSKKSLKKTFEKMDIKKVFEKIGIIAEGVVQEAFATRGFGKWAPNSEMTIALKGSDSPLIDTSQLRKSISSDVKEK
ncbi:MAG: hypothetical protein JRJ39_00255 [Deltaproteobacteria bacterium]|nr:hypothetical protein [Deltaproteobacteria bacterium]